MIIVNIAQRRFQSSKGKSCYNSPLEAVEEAVAEGVTAVTDTTILRQLLREAATAVTMTAFIEKLKALTGSADTCSHESGHIWGVLV